MTSFQVAAALPFLLLGISQQAQAIEEPRFHVLESYEYQGKSIEIREYDSYVVAETIVQGQGFSQASSEGFRRLAGYIFGKNSRQERMEMTAPVGTEGSAEQFIVSFVMPSKYRLEDLPLPQDSRVRIREIPSRRVAAIVFSGFWSERRFSKYTQTLFAALEGSAVKSAGNPWVARYNMPLTPWFLRRNEVLVEIQ